MLAAGTLVQINESAVLGHVANTDAVSRGGWLWIVKKKNKATARDTVAYDCTSLATGFEYYWFTDEFNVAPQEQTSC